jgi:hypothetical protein
MRRGSLENFQKHKSLLRTNCACSSDSELDSWIDRFILDFATLSSSEELMLFGLAIVMDEFSLLLSRLLLLLTLEVVSIGLYFVSIDLVAMEE